MKWHELFANVKYNRENKNVKCNIVLYYTFTFLFSLFVFVCAAGIILYFTFLFSLFVFVSAAGQYNVIWTGTVPASLF
jgi:hypothetical protein